MREREKERERERERARERERERERERREPREREIRYSVLATFDFINPVCENNYIMPSILP